jgi:hypothetical protein
VDPKLEGCEARILDNQLTGELDAVWVTDNCAADTVPAAPAHDYERIESKPNNGKE